MNTCGVLVCGAGPVGLTAALELVRHGVRPRIIDRKDGPTNLSKALILWRRTLEGLDSSIPFERFLDGHQVLSRVNLLDSGHEIATIHPTEGEPKSPPAFPPGILVPQSVTEHVLVEGLKGHGIEVEWQTELTSFNPLDDGVEIVIESADGVEDGRVDWVLGCDGGHSTIRKGLGLSFPGETNEHVWILADIDIAEDADPACIRLEFNREGMVAFFPIAKGRFRVVADLGEPDGT
ncbi:MAG: FAD-dependent monooxygenase, partial [Phycisphaerales bacterium]|nr:FAD-dependent monooxygenase [Phycisphaerales bacterium]